MLPYWTTKRTTILRTARERAGPEGSVGTDVSSLRVSSTLALRGRLSRRSEISSMSDLLGWDHMFPVFGSRRPSRLRGFIRLSHWGLFRAYRDFWTDFAVLTFLLVVVTSLRVGFSVTGPGVGWGTTGGLRLTTRTPRTTLNRCPLSKHRLSFLPVHTAPVVGCVVFSTPAAFKLLL